MFAPLGDWTGAAYFRDCNCLAATMPFHDRDYRDLSFDELVRRAAKWPDLKIKGYKECYKTRNKSLVNAADAFANLVKRQGAVGKTITLSDDLVWAAAELSIKADPIWLHEQALVSRMPYDVTYFEYNWKAKRGALLLSGAQVAACDTADHDQRTALSVETTSSGAAKVLQTVLLYPGDKLCWLPLAICCGEGAQACIKALWDANKHLLSAFNYFIDHEEKRYDTVDFLFTTPSLREHPDLRPYIENAGDVAAMIRSPLGYFCAATKEKYGSDDDLFRSLTSDDAGLYRWFAALCAIMNRPSTIRTISRLPGAPLVSEKDQAQCLPNRATSVLLLPRERVVNLLKVARKPRGDLTEAHSVMGHYVYSHKRAGNPDCNSGSHHWPKHFTRRQICECGALRWWRNESKRGPGDVPEGKRKVYDYVGMGIKIDDSQN